MDSRGVDVVMNKRNVILIGLMGTGKSTVGIALAERLGYRFVDTDARIEEVSGMSIKDMFAELGEAAFRLQETACINNVLADEAQVVATGGGAVLAEVNRQTMLEGGLVVALRASAETIIQRVREDGNRPLLAGDVEERVRAIMESRKHAYDFAHLSIQTDGLAVEEITDRIEAGWRSLA
ncbi:shikimate kinase [Paenibacillus sp. YYML68]|uniref:shikimate kinase n=1 Tax=Paenibacillus sp. YYML68 TaxID=2909250 RepID=UPI002852D65D|nr:shikimate kinase [Paenibacillus sp. YYML68]